MKKIKRKGALAFFLNKKLKSIPLIYKSNRYPRSSMPCYICLEEEGQLMQARGCGCKGSVAIHRECLQEWLEKAENPFKCTVCKGDYAGTFLTNFFTEEEILFHPMGEEEEEEDYFAESTLHDFHGIPIIETEDDLFFRSEENRSMYHQLVDKEYRAIKQESRHRQRNSTRFQHKYPRTVSRRNTSIRK